MADEFFDEIPFDDSEEVVFDNTPVPDEDYTLQLEKAEARKSKAGNPKVSWEFKVVEDDEYGNRRIWHDTPTTGRGAGMFKAVVSGMGYDFDEWFESVGRKLTAEALISLTGERVTARVRTEVPSKETLEKFPNAKERNKINRFL